MTETTTNGHDESLLPPWLPGSEAMQFLGVGSQKLTKLAQKKEIVRKWADGVWSYERASLASYLESSDGENDEKLTANNSELVALLRVSVKHTEDSFKMVHAPAAALIDFYKGELANARARIVHLEGAHDAAVTAREDALTQVHERDLATRNADRKAARWDSAFEILKQTGPALMVQAFETFSDARDPMKGAALRLMQRLTPERVAAMLDAEALDAEERTFLQSVLRAHAEQRSAAAQAASAAATPPAGEPAPTPAPVAAPKAKRVQKGSRRA